MAGVGSPVKVEPKGHAGKIEARMLRTEPGQGCLSLIFLFNHYPDARDITVTAALGQVDSKDTCGDACVRNSRRRKLYDLQAECEVPAEWGDGYVRFARRLEAGGVWVGSVTAK